jgi:hypothetical protein
MPRDWEETSSGWTGTEGTVEEEKAQRTLGPVRDAITASRDLANVNVAAYPKGSYPNRTNVVRDSDMDVAVELTSILQHESSMTLRALRSDPLRTICSPCCARASIASAVARRPSAFHAGV